MILPLVRAELRRLARERPFRGALLAMALLSLLALADSGDRLRRDRQAQALITASTEQRDAQLAHDMLSGAYRKSDFGDLHSPGAVGATVGARPALLPPGPLAVLAVGQRDVWPTAVRVSSRLDPLRDRHDTLESPRALALGHLDLVFVLVHLLPLLIFALGYDLVSGERERGTLPLLLAQPLPFRRILLAKIAARALAFLGVTAALVVLFTLVVGGGQRSASALLGVAATLLLYGAFWFLLTLAIQRLRRSSQTNALLCLGAWLLFVVAIPASLNALVTTLHPVPSRVELLEASRRAQREAGQAETAALARYYGDHPELSRDKVAPDFWVHTTMQNRHVAEALAPLEQRFAAQVAKQQAWVDRASLLSPAVVVQSALTDLAGVGLDRQRAFTTQVSAFHGRYRAFFEEKILRGERFEQEDIRRIPTFTFEEEPGAAQASRVLRALAGLLPPIALLALLALLGLGKTRWLESRAEG